MSYADLGGLGAKQGAPEFCNWTAPSLVAGFVSWLAILALLALKTNRCASAWWIWVPLLIVGGAGFVPQSFLGFLPASQFEVFVDWASALGFGVAAVWLLSGGLAWRHRMLAFAGILGAQIGFSALAFVLGHGATDPEAVGMLIALAVFGAVMSVGLSLAGRLCRGQYGWLRISLWLFLMLAAVWAVIIVPLFLFMRFAAGERVPVGAIAGMELLAMVVSCAALLPFLVLAFVSGFYRERLKGLLHLGAAPSPPVVTRPTPAVEVL